MGKRKRDLDVLRLRKETIRKLAERKLAPDALHQVVGGCWTQQRYTTCCG